MVDRVDSSADLPITPQQVETLIREMLIRDRLHVTPQQAATQIRGMMRRGRRCYLCSGPPRWGGMFVPYDQAACDAPPGKTRTYWYLLCERCHALPDFEERVETPLLREIARTPIDPERN